MPDEITGQGAAPAAASVRDDASAVAAIKRMMQSPQGPSEPAPEADQTTKRKKADPEAQSPEPETEPQSEEPAEADESPEGPPEYDFEELASALEMDPEALKDAVKIKIKEGQALPLRELIQAHLRHADYTRKTQALAEQTKAFQEQQARIQEALRQRSESIAVLEQALLAELRLDNASMEKMLADGDYTDPADYHRAMASLQKKQALLQSLAAQRQQAALQAQQAQAETLKQTREKEQQALVSAMPELKDLKKRDAFQARLASYLTDRGFSEEEVGQYFSGVYDHRHILILDDAARFRALKKQNKEGLKKLAEVPKVVKPGTGTQTSREARPSTEGLKEKLRHVRTKGRKAGDAAALEFIRAIIPKG